MKRFPLFLLAAVTLQRPHTSAAVDFARDIYPIFQRACFECHDASKQKGKLRLDDREAAFGSDGVIVKGDAAKSELYARITLPKDHEDVMPSRGEPLSKADADRIREWIDSGAVWPDGVKPAKHWSYVKPVRPAVPGNAEGGTRNAEWSGANAIDAFVAKRLTEERLHPSPVAEPASLIRRLSLDLIGLPPSPEEVRSFETAAGHDLQSAVEAAADRLLASPEFGVRWARPWLDYARYADSHGFQRDDIRDLWPYRDWVVDALNADMSFDRFTIEQLAGDLLPNATEAQRIATGFNRSAPTNVEAGTDPEETRVNQVHDRVNTIGMVWLGATLECAQCHDHKYDPFSMRDYYGLFAFFNHTALEADRANPKTPGSIRFIGPEMPLSDPALDVRKQELQAQRTAIERQLAALVDSAGDADGETALAKKAANLPVEHVLEIASFESTGGATSEVLPDKSVLISGEPAPNTDTYLIEARTTLTDIRGLKLEALTDDSLPGTGPGRGDAKRPNFVLNNFTVSVAPQSAPDREQRVSFSSATASFVQRNFDVASLLKDNNPRTAGWAIMPEFHKSHWATLQTAQPIGESAGVILRFRLEQNFGGSRTIGRLRLSAITGDPSQQPLPARITETLRIPAAKRTAAQKKALVDFRLKANPEHARLEAKKAQLDAELRKLKPQTTLVMQELSEPRMNAMFERGDFRNPSTPVQPATPAVLHPLNATGLPTRLDLARWLVSRDNPLTARVVVNRWWAEIFGQGLVTTPEDFGIKGEAPTHPELLDWLAVEFMENGWSLKKLLRTIVTSRMYRQSSRITPELFARDDRNLLYARGPRFRLDAEAIRDNAMAISGLLSLRHGGEPIRPWQPDGLWVKVGGQRYDYVVSSGEAKYRRGLYVVWKRAAPYPSFVNFDANARMACRVKRPRSNTPLQALTLMNDPVHVEAAVAFARRILREQPGATVDERITHGFRLALARTPKPDEISVLRALLTRERETRATDPEGAKQFLQSAAPEGGDTDPVEVAAWYAVAAALLNLDETITKG